VAVDKWQASPGHDAAGSDRGLCQFGSHDHCKQRRGVGSFQFPIASLFLLISTASAGQDADSRRYLPNRADEDWTFLKDAPKVDVWDPLKYIPLGSADSFITLSGEVRYRPEGFRVRATQARPGTIDNYLLQRYLFGADVHVGRRARFFAELQSGIINGSLRSPRPTDRNTLDLHQGFFEWSQPIGTQSSVRLKAGRQELSIGSTRLISASPGLNVKRSFNGVAAVFRTPVWTFAAAAAQLVRLGGGVFDDGSDAGQSFWGVAAGRRMTRSWRGEFGAYYLGIDRAASLYAQGLGAERRHTFGVKLTGSRTRIDWNYDALFQSGEFRGAPIRAWAFASESGYRFFVYEWQPRLSVRVDVASGDRDAADPALQAFNPLFPGNSYSGAVGLLGPTNLTDFTVSLMMRPRPNLTVGVEAPSYWRTSTEDGVYGTDLRVLIPPGAGSGRYVGTNPGALVVWQATRHCELQGVVTRFLAGGFLEETFVSSGFGFYSVSATYRF